MPRPAFFLARLSAAVGVIGGAALVLITLAPDGATRMHAWPWSLAYAVTLLAPVALLVVRRLDRTRPLVLPARPWLIATLAAAALVLASAMISPYRGPSLLEASPFLSALALFLVGFDWLQAAPEQFEERRARALVLVGVFFLTIAAVSLGHWVVRLPVAGLNEIIAERNPHPLGHANYTAGLALLMLPVFFILAVRSPGLRWLWTFAGALALALLFTSGSRGGLVGLVALLFGALIASRFGWRRSLALAAASLLVAGALALANTRMRALFAPSDPAAPANVGAVQRHAMVIAGWEMGRARPLLGWGLGTTPLAYPRFRAQLVGGVEDALELHSLPVQLWAELGLTGIAGFVILIGLVLCSAPRDRAVAVAIGAYLVFALTDYQLDVPVFVFTLAGFTALLASTAEPPVSSATRRAVDVILASTAVCFLGFARPDPAPALNVRALVLARHAPTMDEAIRLLEESLALNPNQEIAHFNLGWLLIVRQPAMAEEHFLTAAHLVPDKGGVYFGLALARLNQGHREQAVQALALECLNDPVFLVSPWWRPPEIAALRPQTYAAAQALLRQLSTSPAAPSVTREADYLAALMTWLDQPAVSQAVIITRANTPERAAYFRQAHTFPDFSHASLIAYARERPAYPVLMRNLDLPTPTDLFEVQENALATGAFRFLFPPKGWLPGPLALALLESRPPA